MSEIPADFIYEYYDPTSGDFGPSASFTFDTSTDEGQWILKPYYQLSSANNAFPSESGVLKRYTLQVSRLNYEAAATSPQLYQNPDGSTVSSRLLEINSNDLYTKDRSPTDWVGDDSPTLDQNYGNNTYEDEYQTIKAVYGIPAKFRKIPLCISGATGYFYSLATRPYIITGDSEEYGYLSDWNPDATQLSIDCSASVAATNVTGTGCLVTVTKEGNTFIVSGTSDYFSSINDSNLISELTQAYDGCGTGISLYNITGSGNATSSYEVIDGKDYIVISTQEGSISGTGCFIETFKEGNTTYVSGVPNFYSSLNDSNLISGVTEGSCGSGINLYGVTGKGVVSSEIKEVDGKDYLVISGQVESQQITGTGCFIETFAQDGTTYISGVPNFYSSINQSNLLSGITQGSCGSGINLYSVTGQGIVSSEIKVIDGEETLVISGQAESQQITGTGCFIETFSEGGTTYVSGVPNFYSAINDTNLVEDITAVDCGSGINFYSITGANGLGSDIQNIGGTNYIRITGESSAGTANITGKNCTESAIENIDGTDYVTIEFTGQHFATGNTNSSNIWYQISDHAGGCTNAKDVDLRNLVGTSGVTVAEDGSDLNVGINCDTLLTDCGFQLITLDVCSGDQTLEVEVLGRVL